MRPTASQIDIVKRAATQLMAGDASEAAKTLESFWQDRALDGYTPEPDADEDGYIPPNIERDVERLLDNSISDVADYVSDSLYEMNPDGDNDHMLDQLEAALKQRLPSVTEDAADSVRDGVSYSRDAHSYYGVNPKDFY